MKRLATLFLCCLATASVAAQWHYLSGGRPSGISSVGSSVWAVGQDGLMLVSGDNGQHWRRAHRFTTRNLTDVDFWDLNLGIVTTDGPFIYRTTDGGSTWDSIPMDTVCDRVRFINDNLVVMNGHLTCRRSDLGGRAGSWRRIWGFGNQTFLLDSLNAWDGYAGNVFRSRNGGSTWDHIAYATNWLDRFCFVDTLFGVNHCWWTDSGRTPVTVYGWQITPDAGLSWWTQGDSPFSQFDMDADGRGGVLGVLGGTCYVINRQGVTHSHLPNGAICLDVDAAGGDAEWICGSGGALFFSPDSGLTWNQSRAASADALLDVQFIDSLNGWALASDAVLRTYDGGRTWNARCSIVPGSAFRDMVALDSSTTLVSADSIRWYYAQGQWLCDGTFWLARTTDGGLTWPQVYARSTYSDPAGVGAAQVAAVAPRHFWHIGNRTPGWNSIRSTDGGTTWVDMDSLWSGDGRAEPRDVCFLDTTNGWAIDGNGTIRKTTDAGDTWDVFRVGLNAKKLQMRTILDGWALSDSCLYSTSTGWETCQVLVGGGRLHSFQFADSLHGAVVGANGLILRTTDGGQTWLRDSSEFTSDLHSVCVLDSEHMWATGNNGLVLGFGDWATDVEEPEFSSPAIGYGSRLTVHPNPCRDYAALALSGPASAYLHLSLLDVSGRVLRQIQVPPGERNASLDLHALPAGVYFVSQPGLPAAGCVRLVKLH